MKLSSALKNIQNYPWEHELFIQGRGPWNSDSVCAILNSQDEASLAHARENNLKSVLSVQVVQDIAGNAKKQKENVSESELIGALNFYYKKDAFIELK